MKIIYVTGCDASYFLSTAVLLEAFKFYCPQQLLWVCDFGLAKEQQDLLHQRGILIPKPSALKDNLHPWVYKASLYHYLSSLVYDLVVWIDCDCFPVGPLSFEIEKLVNKATGNQTFIAICRGLIGRTWGLASPPSSILHFGMKADYPYYNSGLWILKSRTILEEWANIIHSVPALGMYEQDAFNYLLYKNKISVICLDNTQWNVTHHDLNNITREEDNTFILKNRQVLVVHMTGNYAKLNISMGPFKGFIRTAKNPSLVNLQIALLKRWYATIMKENA